MLREFRTFIARGNVVDMAVGIIIGAAFTAIVSSLVKDLINPIIGLVTGGIDFSNLFINLGDGQFSTLAAAREAGAPVFAYGAFITAVINFLIVAWVVFVLVKAVNALKDAAESAAAPDAAEPSDPPPPPSPQPTGPTSEELLAEIRDLLKAR